MTVEPISFRSCGKCLGEGIVPMKDDYGWWVCGCGANLVPDGRLQAIKDAPRCEHGNIDEHFMIGRDGINYVLSKDEMGYERERCEGAPELRSLLDALAEEDGYFFLAGTGLEEGNE